MQIVNKDIGDAHRYCSPNLRLHPYKSAAQRRYRRRCKAVIKVWLRDTDDLEEDLDLSIRDHEALSGWDMI